MVEIRLGTMQHLRSSLAAPVAAAAMVWGACVPSSPPAPAPETVVLPPDTVVVFRVDTVEVRTAAAPDPELEQQRARLQLRLLEKEALVEELQEKLDQAIHEVVRSMAKLQSQANRAEAASGMAEAEIALEALKNAGGDDAPELAQAEDLLAMSTVEFNKHNYGGSLYLATQAKTQARAGEGRLMNSNRASMRPGEVLFALPLPLTAARRSNVREGPGLNFDVLFKLDPGAPLVGYSYTDEWVRISGEDGRSGWIFHRLVASRQDGTP